MTDAQLVFAFGGTGMILIAILQAIRLLKDGRFSTSLLVLFGLIMMATFAAYLVLSPVPDAARTAAFTLFGTIAGYLAGVKSRNSDGSTRNGGADLEDDFV